MDRQQGGDSHQHSHPDPQQQQDTTTATVGATVSNSSDDKNPMVMTSMAMDMFNHFDSAGTDLFSSLPPDTMDTVNDHTMWHPTQQQHPQIKREDQQQFAFLPSDLYPPAPTTGYDEQHQQPMAAHRRSLPTNNLIVPSSSSSSYPRQRRYTEGVLPVRPDPSQQHEQQHPMEDDEQRRKNFLERNRQAALKCRQRKKQWLANLQHQVEYLNTDNKQLEHEVTALREEILNLKTLIIAHKDCPMAARRNNNSNDSRDTSNIQQPPNNNNNAADPFYQHPNQEPPPSHMASNTNALSSPTSHRHHHHRPHDLIQQ